MIRQREVAWLKEKSYRWLATYFCVWLAVSYLWLALFYPLMCAPYRATTYTPIDQVDAFEHTITPFTVVMHLPIAWLEDPSTLIASDASTNTSWLIDAHEDSSGPVLTYISVMSVPFVSWLNPIRPLLIVSRVNAKFYKQFQISPPDQPPRFSSRQLRLLTHESYSL